MPTLRYELEVFCSNCYQEFKLSVPHGCRFQPHEKTKDSGYFKRRAGAEFVAKPCPNCRCAMLVLNLSQLPERILQYAKLMQGGIFNA